MTYPKKILREPLPDWLEPANHEKAQPKAIWMYGFGTLGSSTNSGVPSFPNRELFGVRAGKGYGAQRQPNNIDRVSEAEELRQRLDNANNHFRRMAADVLGDEDSVRLLIELYQKATIRIADFDSCQHGIALAKLTAAHFCEVGANFIYITEAGQRFIEWLD